jgi:hypothetical protein
MPKTGVVALTLLVASFTLASVARAEGPSPSPPLIVADSTAEKANIPDSKLDAAAAAVKRVLTLKDTYEQKLARAPDEQKEGIVEEANNAVTKAVTDQGLSVEEFNNIMEVAENNPDVREKLVKRLK